MSNEATIHTSLQISNSTSGFKYRSYPTGYNDDVTGSKGPTPGAIACSTGGTDVDLSELTTPGWCRIENLDPTNYITVGIWDGLTFHEFGEVGPNEFWVIKLSRLVGDAVGTDYGNLRIKADTATCNVLVEAFEK